MPTPSRRDGPLVLRGRVLTFHQDPILNGEDEAYSYWEKGSVIVEDGFILNVGGNLKVPGNAEIIDYGDSLICSGFIDAHVHYPQIDIIASYGEQLLDWLNKYTFPEEARFSIKSVADKASKFFLDELLKNGVTTAAVFCTSHVESVDAFFEESSRRNLRMIAGKVLMDRNAPDNVRDTVKSGYEDTKMLIKKWHKSGRNLYAVTPRFAPTSSPEQLAMAGTLYREHDSVYLQSHVSENLEEIDWVANLYPKADCYLDVYNVHGLLGPRALFGHGIHFSDREIELAASTEMSVIHCPTSNLFMGSGMFEFRKLKGSGVDIAFGSDVAGGTSLSPFSIMKSAYEIAQAKGKSISPLEAFYTVTLGAAKTLKLDHKIGRLAPGLEADLSIIDVNSTPIIKNRVRRADSLSDLLFAQIILADDRAIRATYSAGKMVYRSGELY